MGIKAFEFSPCFVGSKLPVNRESFFGALFCPLLSNLVKLMLRSNTLAFPISEVGVCSCGFLGFYRKFYLLLSPS
jgi:hypothetical protein